MKPVFALVPICALTLASCTTADDLRYEGVTSGAGDAIAANSVMQMVDPWPRGVDDTRLSVPANRAALKPKTADGSSKTDDAMKVGSN